MDTLRIATRQSALALWQAEYVASRLQAAHTGLAVELVGMTTEGDRLLDTPLAKIGGKGLFIKELEQGMLDGRADIAAHSIKDVPVELPSGFSLEVIMSRADPRDALVSNRYRSLGELPAGARVGTCSLRRRCQLAERFPDLQLIDLRGNVNTRLAKLDAAEYDAIILAAAGLQRLGMADRIARYLQPEQCLPAIGQGAIGIECRTDDSQVRRLIQVLDDPKTRVELTAERAMNARLHGSCQVPVAGFAELKGSELFLRGLVGMPDGSRVLRGEIRGERSDAERLGVALANVLLEQGAGEILAALAE